MTRREQLQREVTDPNREVGISTFSTFGGLNTMASVLNIPYEDTDTLLNANVGDDGTINRRKGTRVLRRDSNPVRGCSVVPITTLLNYKYLLIKNGRDLSLLNQTNYAVLLTKTNVWDSKAEDVIPTFVTTSDLETRVIFCTGVNVPIQFLVSEQRHTFTATAGQTSVTLPYTELTKTAALTNSLFYVNGVRVLPVSVSVTGLNMTVVLPTGLAAGNTVLDIQVCTWQWWAESYWYYGDRFMDTKQRFHDKQTDVNVEIPENLRDGVVPYTDPALFSVYPIIPVRWNPATSLFVAGTQSSTRRPGTTQVMDYACSDGAPRNGDEPVNPATLFLTFGSRDTTWNKPGIPDTMYIMRRRNIPFNGDTFFTDTNLHLSVDGVRKTMKTPAMSGAVYGDYRLYYNRTLGVGAYASVSSVTDPANQVDFFGGPPTDVGVPANAIIRLTNTEVKNVGSAASSANTRRTDGCWVPVYGISAFSNYSTGSHPSTITKFQGRLVLGGFPQNPLTCCVSSVGDTSLTGEYQMDFQQDAFTTDESDPYDFVLTSDADDFVISTREYQGSLFVMTRKNLYRVTSTGRGLVTQNNAIVVSVASVGAVNNQAVVNMNDTVVFVSDDGIYAIINGSGAQETTEYRLEEISVKIKNQLQGTNTSKTFLVYDKERRQLYCGVCAKGNYVDSFFVYNTLRDAWSKYTSINGFNAITGVNYDTDKVVMVTSMLLNSAGMATDTTYLLFNTDRYLDWQQTVSAVGVGTYSSIVLPPRNRKVHTTQLGVYNYKPDFYTLPIREFYDTIVSYDGRVLTPDTDFTKSNLGDIVLLFEPEQGKSLVISQLVSNDSHMVAIINNVKTPVTVTNEYSVGADVRSTASVSVSLANSTVTFGTVYLSVYGTPTLTQGMLGTMKRLLYWYGVFRNDVDVFETADLVVGQDAEQIVGKFKQRNNAYLAFTYSYLDEGFVSSDLYTLDELTFDIDFFDLQGYTQSSRDVLIKEPIQGTGVAFRSYLWSSDDGNFCLVGYQVSSRQKGTLYSMRG